jgi:solute carrier family 10 (sodium/bile acid cotransporter), member 7
MKSLNEEPMIVVSMSEDSLVQVPIDDCESPMKEESIKQENTDDFSTSVSDSGEESDSNKDLNVDTGSDGEEIKKSYIGSILGKLWAFYWAYDFPINIMIVICIALAHPKFGAVTVKPKISAGWVATAIIFLISGLGLKTKELFKVMFRRLYFNIFVEVYNFFLVSAFVFGVSRALAVSGAIPQSLADGLAIAACLPMSINAVIVMTQASHGDEAAAIFHTAFSNITGIFLSPVLIVLYLPSITVNVDLLEVFKELTYKVIIPLIVGQVVHLACKFLREFYFAHKKRFKKTQEYCLIFIV